MKKFILLLFTFLLAGGIAVAQETDAPKTKKTLEPLKLRHRISLSYNDGVSFRLGSPFDHFPGLRMPEGVASAGSFNLDYLYILPSGRWGFGVGVGLMPTTAQPYKGLDWSVSDLLLTIAPRVQCTYFRSKLVELYGAASVGVIMSASAIGNRPMAMAWQLDPIAVRVGSERIAGFLSVGWGSRGIVGLGVQVGL